MVQTGFRHHGTNFAKCLQSPYNLTTRYLRYIFIMGQLKSFRYDISSPDFGWTHEEFDMWTISWQTLDTLLLYCIKIIIRFCLTLTYWLLNKHSYENYKYTFLSFWNTSHIKKQLFNNDTSNVRLTWKYLWRFFW